MIPQDTSCKRIVRAHSHTGVSATADCDPCAATGCDRAIEGTGLLVQCSAGHEMHFHAKCFAKEKDQRLAKRTHKHSAKSRTSVHGCIVVIHTPS